MFTLDNFYKSKEWEAFRLTVIADRTEPNGFLYCAHCRKPILNKYDLIIHHKEELTEDNVNDYNISLNPDNVECIHFKCHNKIHERFGYGTGGYKARPKKVYIVYGAPLSGKSSWVQENATPDDLVVDLDSIYECISVNKKYIKPDSIKSVVFDVRDSLYDIIKYRRGRWQDAYIIVTGARIGDRERLKARVNADDFIYIDTKRDECIKRIDGREAPDEIKKEWLKYIIEYFDAFQAE